MMSEVLLSELADPVVPTQLSETIILTFCHSPLHSFGLIHYSDDVTREHFTICVLGTLVYKKDDDPVVKACLEYSTQSAHSSRCMSA